MQEQKWPTELLLCYKQLSVKCWNGFLVFFAQIRPIKVKTTDWEAENTAALLVSIYDYSLGVIIEILLLTCKLMY